MIEIGTCLYRSSSLLHAFTALASRERAMEIVRLPIGKQASVDVDCIRIEEQPGATYKLTASAMCGGAYEGESVSIVGGSMFDTVEQAEASGLAWAENVGVQRLFVSRGTLAHPLELTEIDKPL